MFQTRNAENKTALISLLSTYEDLDKTTNEDRNEEEIEKQCKFTAYTLGDHPIIGAWFELLLNCVSVQQMKQIFKLVIGNALI